MKPKSREESKRETRRALLDAGLQEVVERGLDAPSLDDICARAGYTRGAFYVHFRDRDDFLVQLLDWLIGGFIERILRAESPEDDLLPAIARYTDALAADDLPQDRSGLRLAQMLEAGNRFAPVRHRFQALYRQTFERLRTRIRIGQTQGVVRADVDAGVLATLLVGIALGGSVLKEVGVDLEVQRSRDLLMRLLKPEP
jgi:AcrR family transcriptional regulator